MVGKKSFLSARIFFQGFVNFVSVLIYKLSGVKDGSFSKNKVVNDNALRWETPEIQRFDI